MKTKDESGLFPEPKPTLRWLNLNPAELRFPVLQQLVLHNDGEECWQDVPLLEGPIEATEEQAKAPLTTKPRAYTVKEIDALRQAGEDRYLYGSTYTPPPPPGHTGGLYNHRMSRSYRESDKAATVEEMVRTYMLAGITAKDIIEADRPKGDDK